MLVKFSNYIPYSYPYAIVVLSSGTRCPQHPHIRCPPKHCPRSQNHRMVGVGRDLCGSSSPTPCRSRVTYSRLHRTRSLQGDRFTGMKHKDIRVCQRYWQNPALWTNPSYSKPSDGRNKMIHMPSYHPGAILQRGTSHTLLLSAQ